MFELRVDTFSDRSWLTWLAKNPFGETCESWLSFSA